jgi:hypothetical protein
LIERLRLTTETRTLTSSERCGFIEEEQFSVMPRCHKRFGRTKIISDAHEPTLVHPRPHNFAVLVKRTTVSEESVCGAYIEVTAWCDVVVAFCFRHGVPFDKCVRRAVRVEQARVC